MSEIGAPRAMHTPAVDECLARSVMARALSLGLQPPSERTMRALFSAESRRALREAARVLDTEADETLQAAVRAVSMSPEPTLPRLTTMYDAVFGHTLRGKVCPFETEYGNGPVFQQAQELADISGFYLAFGLGSSVGSSDRLDHVACELEFLDFLSLKEACALEQGETEMLFVTRHALRKFLKDHIGRFGIAFGSSLAREDAGGLYGMLGVLCATFLRAQCRWLGVPEGSELLELRATEDDPAPMACGSAGEPDDLLQIRSTR
jgi:TorA maturation chaperone TorD